MKIKLFYTIFFLCISFIGSTAQHVIINNIIISGNKVSRESVVLRELTFKEGDTLSIEQLEIKMEASRTNLLNTSLFNYVFVNDSTKGNLSNIYVDVEERWYIWPVVDLVFEDRNISTWIRHPDWSRFSFGFGINIENVRGLNEKLKVSARVGYQRGLNFSYSNIALDKAKRHLFGFGAGYNMVHTSSFKTENNKPEYITLENEPTRENYSGSISYLYRPHLHEFHLVNLAYDHTKISDTLLTLNPDYWNDNNTRHNTITASYTYASDYRDSRVYPLKGTLWSLAPTISSEINSGYISGALFSKVNTYLPLSRRWFYAGELSAKLSVANKNTYVADKALGYGTDYLRGYEDYVMDGQHFLLFKNTLRFMLIPTKTVEIKWLSALYKFNKIHFTVYANVFADCGYSYNKNVSPTNNLQNVFLYSGGAGIDFVTYYDIVLRVDYSVNKMGNGGFYITLITPFF